MTDNLEAEARRVAAGLTEAQCRIVAEPLTIHGRLLVACSTATRERIRKAGILEEGTSRLNVLGLAVKRVLEAGL